MKHRFLPALAVILTLSLSSAQLVSTPAFSASSKQKTDFKPKSKIDILLQKHNEEMLELQYERVWQLASQNFLYEDRLRNFESWRDKFKGKLHSNSDYDKACAAMLDSLMDEYTFFRDLHSTGERRSESISHNVVQAKTFKHSIGYIKIRTFSARACVEEARAALRQFAMSRFLILDLRDNWGGSIDDAFAVFQMLVDNGSFVKMVGREDALDYTETLSVDQQQATRMRDGELVCMTRETCIAPAIPILILVNGESKSAAEMLAGALRDNGRAALLGEKTFGKGVVQQVWEFDNGTSVKITSARFFGPSGTPIQGVGLAPDIKVAVARTLDLQLQRAVQLAYANLRKHIAYKKAPPASTEYSIKPRKTTPVSERFLGLRQSAAGNR